MTTIQRTAYPRFKRILTPRMLHDQYTPTADEWTFVQQAARPIQHRFNLLVQLKVFQSLGYFPPIEHIPAAIIDHIQTSAGLDPALQLAYDSVRTMYYHQTTIPTFLGIQSNGQAVRHLATRAVYEAAHRMDLPADLINVAIEALRTAKAELPAFSTLDKIVERVRALVDRQIVQRVSERMPDSVVERLDSLLRVTGPRMRSAFNRLKELPKRATRDHLHMLEDHLHWLESIAHVEDILADIAHTKVVHFAEYAKSLDAADIAGITAPKRYVLMVCLLQQAQVRARDNLAAMVIKYLKQLHGRGQTALEKLREHQRDTVEHLLTVFTDVLETSEAHDDPTILGQEVQAVLTQHGGGEALLAECLVITAYNGDNYLPLLPPFYHAARSALFRLLDLLTIIPTSEDDGLLAALAYLHTLRHLRKAEIPASVDLSFTTDQWRRAIVRTVGKRKKRKVFVRRMFEICVFSALADGLKAGDLAVVGSEQYVDFRTQLLPWADCEALLPAFCRDVGLASTPEGFVLQLWMSLSATASAVDQGYPDQSHLVIAEDGTPALKRLPRWVEPQELALVEGLVHERLPDRTILEALWNVAHWTEWPRHFGPLSGSEPKISEATTRYILTTFCFGANLGPAETERHTRGAISAQTLSTLNRQHVTLRMLEAARRDMIAVYNQLALPTLWGDDSVAGVDGSQYDLAEENLVAEFSFRYRASGGIAYQHISDRYIALFVHFITCGTWEAIYIIDGLLKNTSDIQPTTIHGDTQAQSTLVFALTYLLGIDLMPRIRNWKGLIFFRPSADSRYQHIDGLFRGTINWDLIMTHWQDLMQVVLSIKEGKILASTILRKLSYDSKRNRLYKAFRELGRVIRTIFLLRYISNLELRQQIQGTTTLVESFNAFAAWIFFGNQGIVETNDPIEQEKRLHYRDLIANALILQNTVDLSRVLRELRQEGYPIRRDVVAHLSPYITQNWRRYGDYPAHFDEVPDPLDPSFDVGDEA